MTFGIDPRQPDILDYQGLIRFATPCVNFPRAPTVLDINYPLLTLWRFSNKTPDGSGNVEGDLWYLATFFVSGKNQRANWIKFTTAASNIVAFTGGTNTSGFPVGPDGSGHIQLSSNNASLQLVGNGGAHTIQFQLTGGGSGTLTSLTPDTGTILTSATPTLSANTIIQAAGTFAHFAQTNGISTSVMDWQFQFAGSNPATALSNMFGIAQFDSNQFTVSNGYVQLIGGGTTGAVTILKGDDGMNVVPTAGVITLDGITVANGTNAKPVFFKKNATSTEELDVQVTTTSSSGAKTITNAGLASFDSTEFSVDSATGFISSNAITISLSGGLTGSSSVNLGGTLTLNGGGGGSAFTWVDTAISINPAVKGMGYFCTATLTITLPTDGTSAEGDTIAVYSDVSSASNITIQVNTGQQLRIGSKICTITTGTAVNTQQGDCLFLVYRATPKTWMAINGTGGWTLT